MPITVSLEGAPLDPDGALDPDQVYIMYLCQTGPGEHDPDSPPDDRVRPSHAALHGQIFQLGVDAPIPPLDYGCFLPDTRIAGVFDGACRMLYKGKAVEIRTKNGAILRVTANHPIPTERGLLPAIDLKPGDKLLVNFAEVVPVAGEAVNEKNKPTIIQQVFDLFAELGAIAMTRNRVDHFNGDGAAIHGDINIVGSYALLHRVRDAHTGEHQMNMALAAGHSGGSLPRIAFSKHSREARLPPPQFHAGGSMRGRNLMSPLQRSHSGPLEAFLFALSAKLDASGQKTVRHGFTIQSETLGQRIDGLPLAISRDQFGEVDWRKMQCLRFGTGPHGNASLYEPSPDGLRLDPVEFTNFAQRLSGLVQTDDVSEVRSFDYSGHVYDLRSPFGYVVADGIIASNCRCAIRYVAKPKTKAAEVLKVESDAEPLDNVTPAFESWLGQNAPGWEKIAVAAEAAPDGQEVAAAYAVADKLGLTRDIARMALQVAEARKLKARGLP